MYRFGPNGTLTANHAVWGDFCNAFVKDMKPLYLLAFLLTANHQDAEQCFATALEAASEATVFRAWVRPWIRRTLIKVAIHRVLRRPGDNGQTRDSWGDSGAVTSLFKAVAQLGSLERLVFVIVVLERYSIKECSLLLDCTEQATVTARSHALKDLSSDRALGILLATNGEKLQICS
jgi:DNA-directed RNA polymerase specialized sigma24 family protein